MNTERHGDMIAVTKPLFKLGQCLATPAALRALEEVEEYPWQFLSRHVAGDWGIVDEEDKASNDQAVKDGSRILSAYLLNDGQTKIWVITEATDDQGNRAATTILLSIRLLARRTKEPRTANPQRNEPCRLRSSGSEQGTPTTTTPSMDSKRLPTTLPTWGQLVLSNGATSTA